MSSIIEEFKGSMRNFPASVSVIATGDEQQRAGLTATAVCSLSAQPPQVIVCLNANTGTFNLIKELRRFSVNVLHTRQQTIAQCFGGFDPQLVGEQRFTTGNWKHGELGVPVLSDALAVMECELVEAIPAQSHFILIGAVKEIHQAPRVPTLLYGDGAFGQLSPLAQHAS